MAALEAKVSGYGVAEKLVGAGYYVTVDSGHARETLCRRRFAEMLGGFEGDGGEVFEPVETPLEGADDSVGVACGERGFPGVHPLRVELREHYLQV